MKALVGAFNQEKAGPSRGLLRDNEPLYGTFWSTNIYAPRGRITDITLTFRLGPGLLSSWPSSMAPLVPVSSSSLWKYRSTRDQASTTNTAAKLRRGSRLQLWPPSTGRGIDPTHNSGTMLSWPPPRTWQLYLFEITRRSFILIQHTVRVSHGKPRANTKKLKINRI